MIAGSLFPTHSLPTQHLLSPVSPSFDEASDGNRPFCRENEAGKGSKETPDSMIDVLEEQNQTPSVRTIECYV